MDALKEKICPKCKTANPIAANFCRHCRHEFSDASKKGMSLSPEIKEFEIRENTYTFGSNIHVKWKTVNAKHVKLNGEEVSECAERELLVDKAMPIILTAENEYNSLSKQLKILPSPLPLISYFRISSDHVLCGAKIRLEWKVSGTFLIELSSSEGTTLRLDGLVGNLHLQPKETTTYTLRCYANGDKSIYVEKKVSVRVLNPVRISQFVASKDEIVESKKVSLRWEVKDATSIMLLPSHIDVTRLKSIDMSPSHTTTYRLLATNDLSQDEAVVTVVVQQLPKLKLDETNRLSELQLPSFTSELPFYQSEKISPLPRMAKIKIKRISRKPTFVFNGIRAKWKMFCCKFRKNEL